jgi:hypothetical protein
MHRRLQGQIEEAAMMRGFWHFSCVIFYYVRESHIGQAHHPNSFPNRVSTAHSAIAQQACTLAQDPRLPQFQKWVSAFAGVACSRKRKTWCPLSIVCVMVTFNVNASKENSLSMHSHFGILQCSAGRFSNFDDGRDVDVEDHARTRKYPRTKELSHVVS